MKEYVCQGKFTWNLEGIKRIVFLYFSFLVFGALKQSICAYFWLPKISLLTFFFRFVPYLKLTRGFACTQLLAPLVALHLACILFYLGEKWRAMHAIFQYVGGFGFLTWMVLICKNLVGLLSLPFGYFKEDLGLMSRACRFLIGPGFSVINHRSE